MEFLYFALSNSIWIAYLFYLFTGTNWPEKHRYNRLFTKAGFVKHFLYCLVPATVGIYGMVDFQINNGTWFAPLITTTLIKLADQISLAVQKRHPIFRIRGDNRSGQKENFLDFVFILVIIATPIALTIYFNRLHDVD